MGNYRRHRHPQSTLENKSSTLKLNWKTLKHLKVGVMKFWFANMNLVMASRKLRTMTTTTRKIKSLHVAHLMIDEHSECFNPIPSSSLYFHTASVKCQRNRRSCSEGDENFDAKRDPLKLFPLHLQLIISSGRFPSSCTTPWRFQVSGKVNDRSD